MKKEMKARVMAFYSLIMGMRDADSLRTLFYIPSRLLTPASRLLTLASRLLTPTYRLLTPARSL